MTDADLISLLRDSLRIWGVAGRVGPGTDGVEIVAASGEVLEVTAGAAPLRWFLATGKRRRPVASVGALLEAVRVALGGTSVARAVIGVGANFTSQPTIRDRAPPACAPTSDIHRFTPVSLVTGFLGSGKTTLVSRLLRDPALARTAVIVNEFGEIGLDHDLIESGDETLVQLSTGCLCCAVQTSISRTLLDLERRRAGGEIAFDRVLVETSGLADPAPILHALMTDDAVGVSYAIARVVTLVDAQLGEATLRAHPEARRQASLADLLLVSKTDLCPVSDGLRASLRALNQTAPLRTAIDDPAALFLQRADQVVPENVAQHTPGVSGIVIERDETIPALALTLFIQTLAAQCAGSLLRVKGIVELDEMPGHRIALHGVQNVFSPPAALSGAHDGQARTRIVVIGRDIPAYFPLRLLDAIIAEVRDETAQISVVSTPSVAAPMSAASDIGRP